MGSHSLQAAGAFEGGVPRHTAAKARSWLTGAWSESPDSGQRFRFRCCASLFDAFSPHSAPRRVSALLADTSTSCAWPARRADKRWSQDTSFLGRWCALSCGACSERKQRRWGGRWRRRGGRVQKAGGTGPCTRRSAPSRVMPASISAPGPRNRCYGAGPQKSRGIHTPASTALTPLSGSQ